MERVAVVGLGAMGSRIAMRLLDTGHRLVVWNRSPDKLEPLIARGACAASTPGEAAARSRILITMLADPPALRAASEGPDGIAAGAHPALVVIEMSTVGPPAVRQLASLLGPQTRLVDAPVIGSIAEAASGALTIFAGGPAEAVDEVEPLLATLGTVVRVGALGAGAAAKLVANAALLGTLTVFGETLALADAFELSREAAAAVLAATPLAERARRQLPLIEAGDYPRRFALPLARKDADLIADACAAAALDAPALAAARAWLAAAEAEGRGDADYTATLATILRGRKVTRHHYDGLIVDLDGVIWLGGHPIEGAATTLARLRAGGARVLFLTNDPQHSRETQARRLAEIGIPATADDVLTASAAAAAHLASQERLAGARTFVVGSPAFHDELAAAGLQLVSPDDAEMAEVVVVGGHNRFDYGELQAAMRAVESGAELFGTGRDPFVPTRNVREAGNRRDPRGGRDRHRRHRHNHRQARAAHVRGRAQATRRLYARRDGRRQPRHRHRRCQALAAASPLMRNTDNGRSGLAWRCSLTRNALRSAIAAASATIVRVAPQPTAGACTSV
jgi:3-hydroxyisobutyrate dehydrogenase-like beta-hydroxyacid dehydrogenase